MSFDCFYNSNYIRHPEFVSNSPTQYWPILWVCSISVFMPSSTECLRAFVDPFSLIHSSSLLSRLQPHQLMFVLLYWFSMFKSSLVNIPPISCFEFMMSFSNDSFFLIYLYFILISSKLSQINPKLVFCCCTYLITPSSLLLVFAFEVFLLLNKHLFVESSLLFQHWESIITCMFPRHDLS